MAYEQMGLAQMWGWSHKEERKSQAISTHGSNGTITVIRWASHRGRPDLFWGVKAVWSCLLSQQQWGRYGQQVSTTLIFTCDFWFLVAACLGCLNLCCGLWMESGNNSASVPSQLVGLTPSKVLQSWLLEPLCPSSRCIGMGQKTAMEDPYCGQEDRMTLLWECC